jgi:uncharacterized protein
MATTPQDTAASPLSPADPLNRKWRWRDGATILMIISLAAMVLGSLVARQVNTDNGGVAVTETTIHTADGYDISAFVYTPDSVTPQSPAPGIAMWHGLNNNKGYMSNTALEMARRGFVVVSADQTGHGSSGGVNQSVGCGGPGTLTYLMSLPTVDKANIGLVGMSQGGFCAATAAALSQPDAYKSIFYMESEPNPPGNPNSDPYMGLHNIAFNIGGWTELGSMILVDKGDNAKVSPELLALFGSKDPIVANKVYGSIADGTARILYTPFEDHAGSTDSLGAIGNSIDWMQRTLDYGTSISSSNQVWPIKLLGTTLALLGAFVFLFVMGGMLLRGRSFATLVRPVPEYRGLTGVGWWIGAAITTAVGPLLYYWVWRHMFFTPWLNPNSLWPQTFTNIYMVWAVFVGVIAIALIALNHFGFTRRKGGNFTHYGVTEAGRGIDWAHIGKAIKLVAITIAPVYLILVFVSAVWHVDFRAWVVMLMPMTPDRWLAFFGYLVPFAIFFVAQGIIFGGFLRWKQGKSKLWVEMLVNSIVLTLGALVWLLINYIPLMNGGISPFTDTSDPLSSTAAGLGAIYYIPLLVLFPLSASLYTYFFRKTGRVWVGSIMVTVLIVWSLAATGDFAVLPTTW